MASFARVVMLVLLLPAISGCLRVGEIRIVEDQPEDLEELVAANEFMRVRQLTGRYPALDSKDLQQRLNRLERDYTDAALAEASRLEHDGDLHAAVALLSESLQKMPYNNRLRTRRNRIEDKRVYRVMLNERKTLLSRGNHLLVEIELHEENIRLAPADRSQQHRHEKNLAEAESVSDRLVEHARFAMDHDELAIAMDCLTMAGRLYDNPAAASLRTELRAIRASLEKSTQQKAIIKNARIKRKKTIKDMVQTEKQLAEIRAALKANKLHVARKASLLIPDERKNDQEVKKVLDRLDAAINVRVEQLVSSGDALYRAEKINPALKEWNEALLLSPQHPGISERTARANKVLARLEELKRKQ